MIFTESFKNNREPRPWRDWRRLMAVSITGLGIVFLAYFLLIRSADKKIVRAAIQSSRLAPTVDRLVLERILETISLRQAEYEKLLKTSQ